MQNYSVLENWCSTQNSYVVKFLLPCLLFRLISFEVIFPYKVWLSKFYMKERQCLRERVPVVVWVLQPGVVTSPCADEMQACACSGQRMGSRGRWDTETQIILLPPSSPGLCPLEPPRSLFCFWALLMGFWFTRLTNSQLNQFGGWQSTHLCLVPCAVLAERTLSNPREGLKIEVFSFFFKVAHIDWLVLATTKGELDRLKGLCLC